MPTKRPAVLVLYNQPRAAEGAGAVGGYLESDAGVLAEVQAVEQALAKLGVAHRSMALRSLRDVPSTLADAAEPLVINLVEGFQVNPADCNLVPSLCHTYGKGCTGNTSAALTVALDKWQAKSILQASGLPTPHSTIVAFGQRVPRDLGKGPFIVKPVGTDASEGIDAHSIVPQAGGALSRLVRRIHEEFSQAALVEQYVDGRELNVSVLQRGGKVLVLPIAEIDFSAFDKKTPRIVGYTAKWLADSFEYNNTPRIIPADLPSAVAREVRQLALLAWRALGCQDYARVDFRLDRKGRPYILEVNPNPDISPDAGFAAALSAGGIAYEEFVVAICDNAAARAGMQPQNLRGRQQSKGKAKLPIRYTVKADRESLLQMMRETKFFREDEIDIALEVLDEALAKGPDGHYQSFAVEQDGQAVGWVCYGPTPCTIGTYDVYWLAVSPRYQSRGLGAALMEHAEELIRRRGGRLSIVETNGRESYLPTRRFYLKVGYHEAARVKDFYSPGDDKVVYAKVL